MEADTKQQKVDNKENIQALLVIYNRPNLIRVSRVSFNFWLYASISYLLFNSF